MIDGGAILDDAGRLVGSVLLCQFPGLSQSLRMGVEWAGRGPHFIPVTRGQPSLKTALIRPVLGSLTNFATGPVNSVRLYADLHDVTLDQLTLAGGEGRPLLKALGQDVQRWQRRARKKGYIS
jgi:hypothetical protein